MMKLLDSDSRKSSTFTVLYIYYIYICIQMITPFLKEKNLYSLI